MNAQPAITGILLLLGAGFLIANARLLAESADLARQGQFAAYRAAPGKVGLRPRAGRELALDPFRDRLKVTR